MVPKLSGKNGTGTSFKGAFAYYLHDKRQDGEAARTTTERVDWIELRNVPTRDPDRAAAWMAYTALNQDRLKEASGIAKTGRKSDAHVLAYSLAWHPDEKPSKAEMLRAANESIRVLGAEGHQAAIIAHNDEPHRHVHIVVNRVSAEDGRLLPLSMSKEKLSQWALAYEQERGQVFCQARAEKDQARRTQQEFRRSARGEPSHVRAAARAFGAAANDNPGAFDRARRAQRDKDARLARQTADMRERHSKAWKELGARHKARCADIRTAAAQAVKRTKDEAKTRNAPAWRAVYQRQEQQRARFDARERRITGKIRNALDAITHSKVSQHGEADKGWLAASFNFLRSGQSRRTALEKAQAWERRAIGGQHKAELGATIKTIRQERGTQLDKAKAAFLSGREFLIATQAGEKARNRQAWRERRSERAAAFREAVKEARQEAAREQRRTHAQDGPSWATGRAQKAAHDRGASTRPEREEAAHGPFSGQEPPTNRKPEEETAGRKEERRAERDATTTNTEGPTRHRSKERTRERSRERVRAPSPGFGGFGGGSSGGQGGGAAG